jgi:C-terminal processing protease CtpA/Prc
MGVLSRLSKAEALAKMTQLERKHGTQGLGLLLTSALGSDAEGAEGVRISRIYPNGVADRDGRLIELDKLLSINGVDVSQMKLQDVAQCLKGMGPEVRCSWPAVATQWSIRFAGAEFRRRRILIPSWPFP